MSKYWSDNQKQYEFEYTDNCNFCGFEEDIETCPCCNAHYICKRCAEKALKLRKIDPNCACGAGDKCICIICPDCLGLKYTHFEMTKIKEAVYDTAKYHHLVKDPVFDDFSDSDTETEPESESDADGATDTEEQ